MTMLWVLCTPVQTAIQLMMFGEHFHLKYVGEKISWGIILSDGREISLQWLKHAVLVSDTNTQSKHKPLITLPTCGILCVTSISFNKRSFIVRNQLLWSKQVIPLKARSQSEGAVLKSSNNLTCGPQTSLRPGALSGASSGTSCNFWLNRFHCPNPIYLIAVVADRLSNQHARGPREAGRPHLGILRPLLGKSHCKSLTWVSCVCVCLWESGFTLALAVAFTLALKGQRVFLTYLLWYPSSNLQGWKIQWHYSSVQKWLSAYGHNSSVYLWILLKLKV